MKEYDVEWVITLYAGSPEEAAELALEIMCDPNSTATFFNVRETDDPDGDWIEINVDWI